MRRLSGDVWQQSQAEVEEFIQEHGGDPAALSDAGERKFKQNPRESGAETNEPKRGRGSRNPARFYQRG